MRGISTLVALVVAGTLSAAVKNSKIEYEVDGKKHIGYLAYDDAAGEKRPGVLVFHEWWGLNDHAKKRADSLAALGYVAFAADMYGDGKVVDHPNDARAMATAARKNADAWLAKAKAGLKVLQDQPNVDGDKLAAIGYCFGGSTALVLGYSGAPLKAIATFHAALPTPTPDQAKAIKGRVMVAHGKDDKFISQESIDKFQAALKEAKVSLDFLTFGGVVHSFTVPGVDEKKIEGMKYDKMADEQSWEQMRKVFKETLGK